MDEFGASPVFTPTIASDTSDYSHDLFTPPAAVVKDPFESLGIVTPASTPVGEQVRKGGK